MKSNVTSSLKLGVFALAFIWLPGGLASAGALTLEPPRKNSAEPLDKIDEHVLDEMQKKHIPGLALGVFKGGEIFKAEGTFP